MKLKRSTGVLMSGLIIAALLFVFVMPAQAATMVETDTAVVQDGGQARAESRFVSEFAGFAGSGENARSLYGGLRTGSRITFTAPAGSGSTTGTAVLQFDSPTRPMGNGNVFISTALAREQLARYGITEPTPQQLQAALTGGRITPVGSNTRPVELQGVLVQRADGMGWGAIARSQGVNLGRVVSGLRNDPAMTSTTATAVSTRAATTTTAASGTTAQGTATASAIGANTGPGAAATAAGGRVPDSGGGRGTGIVNASGQAFGAGINAHANAQAGARAASGLTSGLGGAAGARAGGAGSANSQGQGKGLSRH